MTDCCHEAPGAPEGRAGEPRPQREPYRSADLGPVQGKRFCGVSPASNTSEPTVSSMLLTVC